MGNSFKCEEYLVLTYISRSAAKEMFLFLFFIFLQSAQILLHLLKEREKNEDKPWSCKAVYIFSPYSDILINFAKMFFLVDTKPNWRMSSSAYVCTRSGPNMKFSHHVK